MKISDIFEEQQYSQEFYDKVEEKVKELKSETENFKKKYGDEWESVVYGTATNMAKKELGIIWHSLRVLV